MKNKDKEWSFYTVYAWMPSMLKMQELEKDSTVAIYAIIFQFTIHYGNCRCSRDFFTRYTNQSKETVSRNVNALFEKGLITKEINENNTWILTADMNKLPEKIRNELNLDIQNSRVKMTAPDVILTAPNVKMTSGAATLTSKNISNKNNKGCINNSKQSYSMAKFIEKAQNPIYKKNAHNKVGGD